MAGVGGSRNIGSRARILATMIAETAAQAVAMIEVPTIALGLADLAAARIAMAVTGISWMEPVLIARNMHIALVAVPGRGFNDSRSFIALKPSGVGVAQVKHVGGHVHQH